MAARDGEENVATLFGDIHYFYSSAAVIPRHHRFDKGSYVYLFENAVKKRCRIEVANQPGTDDQDAFEGFLDQARVHYSHKHHCMVTLTVGDSVDHDEWHLPTYDPKNDSKYHYKLHSMDIYFWTQQDALLFVNGVRRVLPAPQIEILDEPIPPTGMDSIRQRLEHAAISDPQHRMDSCSLPATVHQFSTSATAVTSDDLPTSLSPPPPPPPPQLAKFVPMAYNPAAPAAPEPVVYREKTPPPDEDPLHPLAVAVAHDYHKQPFTPAFAPQSPFPPGVKSSQLPPNIVNSPSIPQHFSAPPQQPELQSASALPAIVSPATPGLHDSFSDRAFLGPIITSQLPPPPPPPPAPPMPHTSSSQSVASPLPNGALLTQAGGVQSHWASHRNLDRHGSSDYSLHQQFYRPSESDSADYRPPPQHQVKKETRGRMEENASRLERGVTGMLKKFEKKFG